MSSALPDALQSILALTDFSDGDDPKMQSRSVRCQQFKSMGQGSAFAQAAIGAIFVAR